MKSSFIKTFLALILSSLLFQSCGKENAEKVIQQVADCAKILESCKESCKPTQGQINAYIEAQGKCWADPTQGGVFSNVGECLNWVEDNFYGYVAQQKCENLCQESFYECVFGPDWKDLNIKKP